MSGPSDRLAAALADRYRIERELGAGGMATVYLAEDLKHDRKVALKVLKPELAAVLGAERFVVEIKTTASLQHPHILPLFDSGTANGFLYYVMPFIQGETLRDRLNRETQLGVEDAVRIATEVADALPYAHQQGVVHRDIKPENILLANGRPMVADFGIALAVSAAAGGRMTETGLSLGTPHYMSPEQATADKDITGRSDVYSLASVLYEMLTGSPPHVGSSAQQIIMKIIADAPRPVTELRKAVPPNVAAAVAKALEKLPADRFAEARDFAAALQDRGFGHGTIAAGVTAGQVTPGSRFLALLPWGITAALSVALAVLLTSRGGTAPVSPVRFTIPVGADTTISLGGGWVDRGRPTRSAIAFSPDGTVIAYTGWDSTGAWLYKRRLDQEQAEPIPGTEEAYNPFFSPDGQWIGFLVRNSVRRVAVAGGAPETIWQGEQGNWAFFGASWGDDQNIVVSDGESLYRIPAAGGEPQRVAEPDSTRGELALQQPEVLPGSKAVLVQVIRGNNPASAQVVALDVSSGTRTLVVNNGMAPRFAATGHVLFERTGTLMAIGFDPGRREPVGDPVAMMADVMQALLTSNTQYETGASQVAVSANGRLAYATGGMSPERLLRVERLLPSGRIEPLDLPPREYWFLRESPDRRWIASHSGSGQQNDIYLHDVTRGVSQKLNAGGFVNQEPTWSPDGKWIAFASDRDTVNGNIYRMPADGGGEPERLAPSSRGQNMSSWSPDGTIAFLEGGDIWLLPPGGKPAPFFTSPSFERDATFSPDGKWLAYVSNQSSRAEVYVRPVPGPDPAVQVSAEGGSNPAWSPDGLHLYYLSQERLMQVDVVASSPFQVGRPRVLFDRWTLGRTPVRGYDVAADGAFLTVAPLAERPTTVREIHVVLHFSEELKQRLPR